MTMSTTKTRWITALLGLGIAVGCGDGHHSSGPGPEGLEPTQTFAGSASHGGASSGGASSVGGAGKSAGGSAGNAGTFSDGGTVSGAGGDESFDPEAGAGGEPEGGTGGQPEGGGGGEPAEERCGVHEDALVIATTRLPSAVKGKSYDYSLVPLGGSHEGYGFELVSGSLPSGIALDATGRLHGTPDSAGSFAVTVELTDSAQHTTSQNFRVEVSAPPRWRPSHSGSTLTVTDTSHADAPPVTLTTELQETRAYALSPDGTRLAYPVFHEAQGADPKHAELYVVRLSSDQPSTPELLATSYEKDIPFKWAPDSEHLALAANGIRCANVGEATTQIVAVELGIWGTPQWLTATTLSYDVWPKTNVRYSTLRDGAFSTPKELEGIVLGLPYTSAGNELSYTTSGGQQWIDFDSGATKHLAGPASPGLTLVAGNTPDNDAWEITPLHGDAAALSSWPAATQSSFVWSSDAALFAVNDRVDIWRHGREGDYQSSLCVADLAYWRNIPAKAFSPDGTWLFFNHGDTNGIALSAVGIAAGRVLDPVDVATSETIGFGLDYRVSADSRWLVTSEGSVLKNHLTIRRLSAEGVQAPHALSLDENAQVLTFDWAEDSSKLLVRARVVDGLGPTRRVTYEVDVTAANPTWTPTVVDGI